MLGTLAGFKGFLCDARFYEDSIAFTNINRPIDGVVRKNIQKVCQLFIWFKIFDVFLIP